MLRVLTSERPQNRAIEKFNKRCFQIVFEGLNLTKTDFKNYLFKYQR